MYSITYLSTNEYDKSSIVNLVIVEQSVITNLPRERHSVENSNCRSNRWRPDEKVHITPVKHSLQALCMRLCLRVRARRCSAKSGGGVTTNANWYWS